MNDQERKRYYDLGLTVCDTRHPINDKGVRRMTKADIIVLVGELAERVDALERVVEPARAYVNDANQRDFFRLEAALAALDGGDDATH